MVSEICGVLICRVIGPGQALFSASSLQLPLGQLKEGANQQQWVFTLCTQWQAMFRKGFSVLASPQASNICTIQPCAVPSPTQGTCDNLVAGQSLLTDRCMHNSRVISVQQVYQMMTRRLQLSPLDLQRHSLW